MLGAPNLLTFGRSLQTYLGTTNTESLLDQSRMNISLIWLYCLTISVSTEIRLSPWHCNQNCHGQQEHKEAEHQISDPDTN
jgi:hypothetical protein